MCEGGEGGGGAGACVAWVWAKVVFAVGIQVRETVWGVVTAKWLTGSLVFPD